MGQDLGQISIFFWDGLSVIGEDLGSFAKWACIDKQIDIWAKVVKDNGSQQMERWVQPLRERGLWVPFPWRHWVGLLINGFLAGKGRNDVSRMGGIRSIPDARRSGRTPSFGLSAHQ